MVLKIVSLATLNLVFNSIFQVPEGVEIFKLLNFGSVF